MICVVDDGRCALHGVKLVEVNMAATIFSETSIGSSEVKTSESPERLKVCPQCETGKRMIAEYGRDNARALAKRVRGEP